MDAITMLRTAVAACNCRLRRLSQKKNPPNWLALLHGLRAASGLTLLLYAALTA